MNHVLTGVPVSLEIHGTMEPSGTAIVFFATLRQTLREKETRWTPVPGGFWQWHGEIAKRKGSGTILTLWNRTGALS